MLLENLNGNEEYDLSKVDYVKAMIPILGKSSIEKIVNTTEDKKRDEVRSELNEQKTGLLFMYGIALPSFVGIYYGDKIVEGVKYLNDLLF